MHKFQLGNKIKDLVSGAVGITTGRIQYINGCVQYNIQQPVDKDGKQPDSFYYDQNQLEFVDEGIADKVKSNVAGSPDTGAANSQPRARQ
jgi:hypothetical protein